MTDHIISLDYKKNEKLSRLFQSIAEGNTILFLGAGASVTDEKRFLSKDIVDFFEDKKRINLNIDDITEFVDAISSDSNFSRDEFDNYVTECLSRLKITDGHRIISKTPWRLIITTNVDELIEKAFAEVQGTSDEVYKIKIARSPEEYRSIQARDEVKFVKLHGSISERKTYKLIFSTEDFKRVEKFYREVLNDLRNISDQVSFLSIGYSYSDSFAKKLLEKIDSFGFRQKRVIYNVDPNVNPAILPLLASKDICVVQARMDEFFETFNRWREEKNMSAAYLKKYSYTNDQNTPLFIPIHIARRIGDNLKQLNADYRSKFIPDSEFYKGEEPNYGVILRNYDVVKNSKLSEIEADIVAILNKYTETRLLPIVFLTGTFGSGKSTFAYRLMNRLNANNPSTISFELFDPSEISPIDLKEVFLKSGCKNIIIYVDTVAIDNIFKTFLELRNKFSIEASPEFNVIFLATIRENILIKLNEDRAIRNSYEYNIDCKFSKPEVEDLVEKLKKSGSLNLRDINEEKSVVEKITKEYSGDSYTTLLELVQGNKLIDDLLEAYSQLSEKCKKAFIYTSLLYQYKILMPSGLLNSLLSNDWNDFRLQVIEKDGKGILIQETINSKGVDPDLYFRTKHPLISKKLIQEILKNDDSKYNHIKSIVTHLIKSNKSSRLVINFLKAMAINKDMIPSKINNLFDLADQQLGDDSYFLLHYAINLQHRQNEEDIIKAIERIKYAESFSDRPQRNHYLIHRRGVLSFELAKLLMKKKNPALSFRINKYLNEAKDFLDIKRRLDPFSSYSYYDLLNLQMWCLENIEEEKNEKLYRRIQIEELFDMATRVVFENSNKIFELQNKFVQQYKFKNEMEYLLFLQEYYEDNDTRPYALILIFNFYLGKESEQECEKYLFELESLILNNEVRKVLLKYYGRNLFDPQTRIKFFKMIRDFPDIEESEGLRYKYYNFVAECYNRNFKHAHQFLYNIKESFSHINPDFHQTWVDNEIREQATFEAILKVDRRGKRLFYLPELNQWLRPDNWDTTWKINSKYSVNVNFYIYGLRVEILEKLSESDELEEYVEDGNEVEF